MGVANASYWFVCACEKGHLQDINWKWVVHGNEPCQEPMWVEEKGTSADPADMSIVCGCGKQASLQSLFQPGRMGNCRGERPWLLDRDPNSCDQKLRLLTRTATNTYFPQVYTVISLPSEEDELTRLVDELSGELANVRDVQHVAMAKQFNSKVAATLGNYPDAEIFARLTRIREGATVDSGRSPKLAEFDVFASGRTEIGQNHPTAKLYAQTLPRESWADPSARLDLSVIKNLVAVHRLREVSCLYGFTRFEAAPTSGDGELEDVQLAVHGAPIAQHADWLPAIEQFGEGIFIHFEEAAIAEWLEKAATRHRHDFQRLRTLEQTIHGQGAELPRYGLCTPAQPLACADVGDRARLWLSGELAEGTGLRLVRHWRCAEPLRESDLHGNRGSPGDVGGPGGRGAPVCAHSSPRTGARGNLLQ
jgi:hypothetical protein